jgi:oligopeptide transport system substrate-binding protein
MFLCNGGNNRTNWCNKTYDQLILKQAPEAKTHNERLEIFKQAEKILLQEMPVIPIYVYTSNNLVQLSVKNFGRNILNQANYREMFLEPQAAKEVVK